MSATTTNKPAFRISQVVLIVFIIDGSKVLLGTKKTRKYPWRGYGGNLKALNERNELKMSIRESVPEYLPGIQFDIRKLKRVGIVDSFKPGNDSDTPDWITYIYTLDWKDCTGEIKATKEMQRPTWFDIKKLPFKQMVPCYKAFLKKMLTSNGFTELQIRYTPEHKYKIKKV